VLNDGVLFEKERPLDRLEDHLSTGSRTGVRGKKKRKASRQARGPVLVERKKKGHSRSGLQFFWSKDYFTLV